VDVSISVLWHVLEAFRNTVKFERVDK